ncbi:hypothetical protein BDV95DRAFT_623790 [Massariosphaeria phaeospora]|uniref:Uncharacterized protein n=1 Tax=Massariosphaeria phaeospora TaxID=100035 RepID=A0A7C8I6C2_9PLEO|nr:hypothetical protein BDV95DRAFT_623790 [Massariosphaeria phaeospora]
MILRAPLLLIAALVAPLCTADIAPEITTVAEGYSYIAKLPCLGCPFLFQDTSQGSNGPWTERKDHNALLFNITLPYANPTTIYINSAPIPLTTSPHSLSHSLPTIHAPQTLSDLSPADLSTLLSSTPHLFETTASHETSSAPSFGLSYRLSLRRIHPWPTALLFHLDITDLHSALLSPPLSHPATDAAQQMLELVLLQRPVRSALDPSTPFEIISARLAPRPRPRNPTSSAFQHTMRFLDWDAHGRKGTPAHTVAALTASLLAFIDSGVWALLVFVFAVLALFVLVCVFCVLGCGGWREDEYGRAQTGKGASRRKGGDVESGRGSGRGKFLSAEDLGLARARVVGVGKSD